MADTTDNREGHEWRVLYRVAETAATAQDLQAFYRAMHTIVGELMDATNFYIALYDDERQRINFPYYVDEIDDDLPTLFSGNRSASATHGAPPHTYCAAASHSSSIPRTWTGSSRPA